MNKKSLCLFILIVFLSSCASSVLVQKRRYQKGYNIDFSLAGKNHKSSIRTVLFEEVKLEESVALADEKFVLSVSENVKTDTVKIVLAQDSIIRQNKNISAAKISGIQKKSKSKFIAVSEEEKEEKHSWQYYIMLIGILLMGIGLLLFLYFSGTGLLLMFLLAMILEAIALASLAFKSRSRKYLLLTLGLVFSILGLILSIAGIVGPVLFAMGMIMEIISLFTFFFPFKFREILISLGLIGINIFLLLVFIMMLDAGN